MTRPQRTAIVAASSEAFMSHRFLLTLALSVHVVAGCASDASAPSGGTGGTLAPFPGAVSVASPLKGSSAPTTAARLRSVFPEWLVPTAHAAGTYGSAFAESTKRIAGVLDGTVAVTSAFDPNAFGRKLQLTQCYGPTMSYMNHPDGPSGNSGQLPQGDLGLWSETEGTTGEACAAAELNALLASDSAHAHAALVGLAAMVRVIGGALPAAGATTSALAGMNALRIPGVTITTANLSLDATSKTWSYALDFSAPGSKDVTVRLEHTPGASANVYAGKYQVSVAGEPPFPNCTTASTVDSLSASYDRSSASSLVLASRRGTYCATSLAGLPSALLGTDGLLDPSVKWPATASGWGGNFGRFGASFDPTSDTLKGDYAYAWQAGPQDAHARLFNIRINGTSADGEAFYGYGDDIGTTDGTLKGLICNWAGPGGTRRLETSYAQRQFVAFDAASGLWRQPAGGSDIRYAPTNDCTYTNATRSGGATFWYDRDLTGATSGSATQANLIVDATDAVYPLDLFSKGTSATIADALVARGGKLPPRL
jgi:hypothetical protein